MDTSKVAAVVLAAGEGTRIKHKPQGINKVAMPLGGQPMVMYGVNTLKKLALAQIILVVGYARESIMSLFGDSVDYAVQEELLGTGYAVACALPVLEPGIDYVLVIQGDDSAFYTPEILQKLLQTCIPNNTDLTFLTLKKNNPFGLGRILRSKDGEVIGIVEEKNATDEQKHIKEINLGAYCFKRSFLEKFIPLIEFDEVKHEKYLTELIRLAKEHGRSMKAVLLQDESLWFGINTDEQLQEANKKITSSQ